MSKRIAFVCAGILTSGLLLAEGTVFPFDEAHWDLGGATVSQHLGRPALAGMAVLKDVEFENGVIEVDVAVTGARSYPGVVFRSLPDGSWERFYIRPHRSGRVPPSLYTDVLQYVPSWNRVDSWQLYSGPGFTAGAVIPAGRWFHVRIEVARERARIFVDGGAEAALEIPRLRHGVREGGIALMGPADGSAFFSSFSVRTDVTPEFGPARRRDVAPGFIRSWQVSQVLPALELDDSASTPPVPAAGLVWRDVTADEDGLVDVARVHGRTGQPDAVFLRTTISAESAELRSLKIGYSDFVTVYLNGSKVFSADSSYQGRDPSFLGILGVFDTVCLPLKAGDNELLLALSELSGGWGIKVQQADAELRVPGLTRAWRTGKAFAVPESVAWDPPRRVLYVSSFDPFHPSRDEGRQVVYRLGLDGRAPEVLARGLRNPNGLAVRGDTLFAVEARGVVEVALSAGAVARRIEVPGAVRLNDIDVDGAGVLYVSDPQGDTIYRIADGKAEAWLRGAEVGRPNGVLVSGGRLVFANNQDATLKAVDLESGQVTRVADLPGGLLDGVAAGPDGSFLVSHNEGRLYRVSATGDVTLLLDLTAPGTSIADLTYIPEEGLIVFPTFFDGRVVAERLAAVQ